MYDVPETKPIVLAILNYVQLYVFSVSIKYLNEKH